MTCTAQPIHFAGPSPGRLPWWAFGLAIVLLTGLALFFCTGVIASDDTYYLDIARHWRPGGDRLSAAPQTYARLGMWYPIRVATWIVGDSWRALMWPPLISAGATLLAVAVVGRRWFGDRAALLAVIALGLTTHFLISATIAVPDIVAAAAVAWALALAGPPLLDRGCKRAMLMAVSGGLVIGIGYAAKEPTALLLPSLGLFVLLRRTGCGWAWKRLAALAAGAALWLAFEAGVLWHYTGDPFYHYTSVRDCHIGYGAPLTDLTLAGLLDHWTQYVRWMMDPRYVFGWWGPVYLAAMAFALWRSNDRTRIVLCTIVCLGVYLSVGSSNLGSYVPLWHQPRYLIPLMPPAALLIGYAADWFLRRQRLLAGATLIAGVCLTVGSMYWANQAAGRWYAARDFSAGRILLSRSDPPPSWRDRVCASGHTAYRLSLLFEEADLGRVQAMGDPPRTAPDWMEDYGGCYLFVSGPDRRPPPPGHRMSLLTPEAVEALEGFEVVAQAAPPSSRGREVLSRLGLLAPKSDSSDRIEVIEIPQPTAVSPDE